MVLSPLLGLESARRSAQDLPNSQVRPQDPQPALQGVASWLATPTPPKRSMGATFGEKPESTIHRGDPKPTPLRPPK